MEPGLGIPAESPRYSMASLADQFLEDVESSASEHSEDNKTENITTEESKEFKTDSSLPLPPSISETVLPLLARIEALSSTPAEGEYSTVTESLDEITSINEHVSSCHAQLKNAFAPRFPELETLIFQPLDYARVARLSAAETDLTSVDLRSVLPSGTVITVQLAFSTTSGRQLTKAEIGNVYELCDTLVTLDKWRSQLLQHVEDSAEHMAPNLVAVVGGAIAARLMALAGGLKSLATMPSCNVKLLGKNNGLLQGTSSATTRQHEGVLFKCPLVMGLPKSVRSRAGEVVSGKACLAARVDACRSSRDGSMGRGLRKGLEAKFAKWLEPSPARTAKPLPIPGDEAKRTHRGGRRARKEKERLGITDIRRLANRVKFGEEEASAGNDPENEGFGMLGQAGSGRLRVQVKRTDTVSVASKRRLAKQKKREERSQAESLGLSDRPVIAADDSIELRARPSIHENNQNGMKSNYFSASTPFLGLEKKEAEGEERKRKRPRID